MIKKLFIYKSPLFDPYENLAIEKHLTDNCPDDAMILYLWQNDNTIVIGQNQNPYTECSPDGGELYIARRLSGGGAVYHDRGNLNFTFICNTGDMNIAKNMEIIKKACALAGIETELSGRNDLLAEGRKFSGNAFYNTKTNAYHHGTIMINCDIKRMSALLTPPKAKLEAKGVKSVRSRVINLSELKESLTAEAMKSYMTASAEEILGLQAVYMDIPASEDIQKDAMIYSSKEYIYGKTPPFTKEAEGRFEWGYVRIILDIKKNIVTNAMLYTDAMDWALGEKFENALIGCEFSREKILLALSSKTDKAIAEALADLIF